MPFISKKIKRLCKHCKNEVKKSFHKGKWNGYNETCGDEKCLKKRFENRQKKKKCKYCDKECKRTKKSGNLTTCGSENCLKKSNKNRQKKIKISIENNPRKLTCSICNEFFFCNSPGPIKYCKECAPNMIWCKRAGKYGIGKKQWDVILKKQDYKCALCDKEPKVVDHCHNENIVRGLLCHSCNINIMMLDKKDDFIKKALKYTGKKYV